MSRTLILDTSSDLLYVAILENANELYVKTLFGHNNHSENLMNVITEGLQQTALAMKDFEKIVVGIGPGSYTGLRVALAIAKMFSWTLQIPLYTISSLDLLGSGNYERDGVYAITNIAKKKHLYAKIVEVKDGNISVLSDDEFIEEEKFKEKLKGYPKATIAEHIQSSSIIMKLATKVKNDELHELVPNYLRVANS